MKYFITFFFFVFIGIAAKAQKIVYEKTFGSPYASFTPNAAANDSAGNLYITGRYDTSVEYFKKDANGNVSIADSTLPYGPLLFVYKISPEGKMLKRVFLAALEGMDIIVKSNGNILVTGFMNRYRTENYKGDKTQGVRLFELSKELELIGSQTFPSFYNSVPYKIMETKEGNILIVAHSLIYKDTIKWGLYDTDANRIIIIDKTGKLIRDTLLNMAAYSYNGYDYDTRTYHLKNQLPTCSVYDVKETANGYLFCATSFNETPTKSRFFLFETDKHLALISTRKTDIPRAPYSAYSTIDDAYVGNMAADSAGILVCGRMMYSDNKNIAVYYNWNFDTLWTVRPKGYSLDPPTVALLPDHRYLLANANIHDDAHELQLWTISSDGKNSSALTTSTLKYSQVYDVLVVGNFAYVIGDSNEQTRHTFLVKVSLH